MQKDLIIKRIALYDEVLKSREKFRLPPPNILCICDHYTKVLHDVLLFHHFHAPPFPKRFRFRMISMFNYIISRGWEIYIFNIFIKTSPIHRMYPVFITSKKPAYGLFASVNHLENAMLSPVEKGDRGAVNKDYPGIKENDANERSVFLK